MSKGPGKPGAGSARPRVIALLAVVIVVLFTTAVRFRLLDAPLDRDSGEYAYAGQLLLQGSAPYGEVYNMKMPGAYAAYAAVMGVLGQTPVGIHAGLLIVNVATILLVLLLAGRFLDRFGATVAAVSFGLLSLGEQVRGTFAKAEHFLVLFAAGGLVLLVMSLDRKSRTLLFVSGLPLGLAFLMKQHAVVFIAFALIYTAARGVRRDSSGIKSTALDLSALAVAVLLPFAFTCALLWRAGVLERFWFWTVTYAWQYVTAQPPAEALSKFTTTIARIGGSSVLIWVLAGVGLASLPWDPDSRRRGGFVVGYVLASVAAVLPGLYFRPHYFLMMLPAVALSAGLGGSFLVRIAAGRGSAAWAVVPSALVLAVCSHGVFQQRDFLFRMTPEMATRSSFRGNPFVEARVIGRFLRDASLRGDRIAVIGSEPEIYFYARRKSATSYIYTYALMELHPYARQMQQEMIDQIETARPRFLVLVNNPLSWLRRSDSETLVVDWLNDFQAGYRRVGIIDMMSWDRSVYVWGEDAVDYRPRSSSWLMVLERMANVESG